MLLIQPPVTPIMPRTTVFSKEEKTPSRVLTPPSCRVELIVAHSCILFSIKVPRITFRTMRRIVAILNPMFTR